MPEQTEAEVGHHAALHVHIGLVGYNSGEAGQISGKAVHAALEPERQARVVAGTDAVGQVQEATGLPRGSDAVVHGGKTDRQVLVAQRRMGHEGLCGRCTLEAHPLVAAQRHHRKDVAATGIGWVEGQRIEHVLAEQRILLRPGGRAIHEQQRKR
ncbi:MAG: hypothetical protein MUE88_05735 [Flavobacteriales bacterium]|nr:hypothetical protein [Flavobacteriales bacterium]